MSLRRLLSHCVVSFSLTREQQLVPGLKDVRRQKLNRILRRALGWSIIGRKSLHLVWVRSESNPSDYPSRKRKIPPPSDNASSISKLAFGEELDQYRIRRSNRDIWRECRLRRTRRVFP